MKKILQLTLLLTFSIVHFANAQTNYQPGGIELSNGTVVQGYINYKEWSNTPQIIQFKTEQGQVQDFTNKTINGFWVDNAEAYEKHHVSITTAASRKIEDLPIGRDLSRRKDSVLLKQLVTGAQIDLLEFRDEIKTRYYVVEHATDTIYELLQLKYFDNTQDNKIVTDDIFKNQLLNLSMRSGIENSTQLKRAIERSSYREADLIPIARLLNSDKTEVPKTKWYNAYAGLAILNTRGSFWGNHALVGQPASMSYNPKVSLGFDAYLNPRIKKTFIRFDLSFATLRYKIGGITYQAQFETIYEEYDIQQLATQFCPQLIHNFYNQPFLRINGGVGFGVEVSGTMKNNISMSRKSNGESNDRPYQISNLRLLVPFRIGAIVKDKFDVYLQHNRYLSSIDNLLYNGIRTNTTQIGINYLF